MAIDRVRAYLRTFGAEERILEFPVSSATVALAAQALGCEEARIAKTLSFAQRAASSSSPRATPRSTMQSSRRALP